MARVRPTPGHFGRYDWLILGVSLAVHAGLITLLPQTSAMDRTAPTRLELTIAAAQPPALEPIPAGQPAKVSPKRSSFHVLAQPAPSAPSPPRSGTASELSTGVASGLSVLSGGDGLGLSLGPQAGQDGSGPGPFFPALGSPSAKPLPASPAPEPASPPAPAQPAVDVQSLVSDYAAQVKAQVLVHKAYPNLAERLGHEGTVKVGFTVKEDGSLEGVTVKVPSGFAELDQAAVDAVLQAEPFAPFPLGLNETGLALTLTLHFRLE